MSNLFLYMSDEEVVETQLRQGGKAGGILLQHKREYENESQSNFPPFF